MMTHLYLITGACPQTEAELRLELADIAEQNGKYREALEWHAVVARWRREWRQKGPATRGGDPDRQVGEHSVMFWHDPAPSGVVCPCGHFSSHLCDEPLGRGMTCDLPLCRCCRTAIADDLDLCAVHAMRAIG
jgi:hypothetical protein